MHAMKSNESKTRETTSRASAHIRSKAGSTSYLSIQPKLTVSQVGDVYEQEAERLAQQVMNKPESVTKPQTDTSEVATPVQRTGVSSKGIQLKDDHFEGHLSLSKRGGKPLPEDVRSFMEQHIGADFSNVQIHENSEADQMNRMLSAQAFTHNKDIYFSAGRYNPQSTEGKGLLAHELTHVVQQIGGESGKKTSSTGTSEASTPVSTVQSNTIQRSFFSSLGSLFGGGSPAPGAAPQQEGPLGGLLGGIGSAIGGVSSLGQGIQSGNPANIMSSALGLGSGLLGTVNQVSGGALGPLGAISGALGAGQSAVNSFSRGNFMEGGLSALSGVGQGLGAFGRWF